MIRRPPRSTLDRSSAASDVYKRQDEVLGRVFELFYSTKIETGQIRGRGLFTCRQFIQRCGGAVDLESQVGVGTTCIIRLPALR